MLILAAGAMGNAADPDALALRPAVAVRAASAATSASTATTSRRVEYDPKKVRDVLGLPGYGQFYKGKPITTMTYDFWVGRRAHRYDGTRFTLQEIFLSSLTNFLYDDGRAPEGEPSWWGLQKKRAISTWNNRIELLAMVEDTHDGALLRRAADRRRRVRPNAGPGRDRAVRLHALASSRSACASRPNAAMKQIAERRGLGRFMKLTETQGALRVASARRLPDGGVAGPRRRRPPLRGVRQRGALLHGLLGDPDLARASTRR